MSRGFVKEADYVEPAPPRRVPARVPEPPRDPRVAALGATVGVRDAGATESEFTLVGEDDVDVARGLIGTTSPLGLALLGAAAGDVVVWQRPAGARTLHVTSVRYGAVVSAATL